MNSTSRWIHLFEAINCEALSLSRIWPFPKLELHHMKAIMNDLAFGQWNDLRGSFNTDR